MATPPLSDAHVRAFGNQLVEVHIWLREQLARLRYDAAPVLEALERDHVFVDGILRRVEELVASAAHDDAADGAVGVRAELDGLAALLDSHFAYEERELTALLNDLGDGRGTPA